MNQNKINKDNNYNCKFYLTVVNLINVDFDNRGINLLEKGFIMIRIKSVCPGISFVLWWLQNNTIQTECKITKQNSLIIYQVQQNKNNI